MTIAQTLISHLHVTTNVTAYTAVNDAAPSGAADSILVATFVATAATLTNPSSVTGHGVTWTQLATVDQGTNARLYLWIADGNGATNTAQLVATWAVGRTGCGIVVREYTGVTKTGTLTAVGAGNPIVQAPTATGTGTASAVTLSAFADSANREACFAYHPANEAVSKDLTAGWVLDANAAGNWINISSGWGSEVNVTSQDATCSMIWTTNANYATMAFEINGAAAVASPLRSLIVTQAVNQAAVW